MLGSIFRFEVLYQLKRPLLWLVFFAFALMTFGATTSDTVQLGGAIGNVHRNAPFVILQWMTVMSIIGMFVYVVFVASSVHRDVEHNTLALFLSKPIQKHDYLGGRFSGGIVVSALVFVGTALGIIVGSFMPWLEPERLGPFDLGPYLYSFAVFVLPNLVLVGAVFFTLAALTRSMLFTYLGVVGFFVCWAVAQSMLGEIENQQLAAYLDPFGIGALDLATRYWTVVEKNTALPRLADGGILLNRVIWTTVGLVVFAAGVLAFDPAKTGRRWRRRAKLAEADTATPVVTPSLALPRAARSFTLGAHLRQLANQMRLEVVSTLKSVPFLVMLAFGMANLILSARNITMFGTSIWPVTHRMIDLVQGTFLFLLVIIIIFYSGELVGKEKAIKLNEVYDALPVPTWVVLAGKLAAIVAVIAGFIVVAALTAMGIQAWNGYYRFEPGLYAQGLLITAVPFLLIAVLAVFLQAITNNKFVGYLLMIVFLISDGVLGSLDFDHNLYHYAGWPSMQYSDMNGYGHFLKPFFWFSLYWSCFALVLWALSILFRVRGTESVWRTRLRQAGGRFRGPVRAALLVGLAGFVATGGWIFYNTNVLNRYIPGDVQEEMRAEYEKKYRQHKDVPLPRITAVDVAVDIFPEERRMTARGRYELQNRSGQPIDVLHLNIPPEVEVGKLRFPAHRLEHADTRLGYYIYRFDRPLQPGERTAFEFEVSADNPGFVNGGSDTGLVGNGTFFNNGQYFPTFGYNEGGELVDRNDRRKHDLPPVHRMAKVGDMAARQNTYITDDSDWIDFKATVSTSPDQIAIAPGYLMREWTEDGRRYFRYEMDAPILHFYSFLSADYQVRRDRWNDVAIEVYYHEPHTYNVDRMIDSVKKSLDYFTTNFSPYQHRQVRIIEFPGYQSFAQSFPNTIPYSESIGFIANLRDPDDIDYVFYITAHEVAHQWWAHQVIGGNVQGATMLSETMSQYSALMVMEKEYGPEKMRRFLKYELDNYLRSRGSELVEEVPLMLVENQGYIHYRKGSLIMYALKDAIGEEAVNSALRRYIEKVGFQRPPFTSTPELMALFEEVTPPAQRALLDDMFREITLFENRVTEATATPRPDGRYDVVLTVDAKKVTADGQGVETPVALDDWIDIGVFAEKEKGEETEEKVLYLQKHRITKPQETFHLVVDAAPTRAGIDPYNKLVDRNSDDNRKKVDEKAAAAAPAG